MVIPLPFWLYFLMMRSKGKLLSPTVLIRPYEMDFSQIQQKYDRTFLGKSSLVFAIRKDIGWTLSEG